MTVLVNKTPFPAELLPGQDASGRFFVTAVVRGTFRVGARGRLVPAEAQQGVQLEDVYYRDPASSSVQKSSDLAWYKPKTDILLHGTAYAPAGRRVKRLTVSVQVGSFRKALLVVGDRVWAGHLGAPVASEPEPFEAMPLSFERAFGGPGFADNPAGIGFHADAPPSGAPLPNLEQEGQPIRGWRDRYEPQSFAAIAGHWPPRRAYIGTYDDAWRAERYPLPPDDFDHRFFQAAAAELQCEPHLSGDEAFEVLGATPEGPLRFQLPAGAIALAVQFRTGKPHRRLAALDTVEIDTDKAEISLVWRHLIACRTRIHDVEEVVAFPLRMATIRRLANAPR